MDIKDYITSGILENYVFGTTSSQETQEVECMSHIYPEIKEALTSLQAGIEKIAEKYATEPPVALKAKVLELIKVTPQAEESNSETTETEPKIIPISSQASSSNRVSKFMAAASIVALIGVGTYAFFLRSTVNSTETALASTTDSLNLLRGDLDQLHTENALINDQMALVSDQMDFIRDQNTRKIELLGTPEYASNLATVFWNNSSEKVMLDVKNLPQTGPDESYQLWVLIGGVPQDMGVFDFEINADSLGLLEMKSTGLADAFAITREPKGGSVSPTLENLQVIGTI